MKIAIPIILCSLLSFVERVRSYGSESTPPNIILVMTDDQGYGDLGCHGHPFLKTPNIDRLYSQGTRFTDFHVSPTCAPTRAALMSGKAPFKNGITHTILERDRMALSSTTIAEVLKSAGYTTGIFGKWHLGDEDEYQPDRRGFDEVFIHGAGGIGQTYAGSQSDAPGTGYFNPIVKHNGQFVQTEGYCTDVFFEQSLGWIQSKKDAGKPFFAYLATNAPHAPYIVDPKYPDVYQGKCSEQSAKFFGMIANIDENMGLLMKKLDEWKLADNTVLIFMTDNGSAAGTYNFGMKGKKGSPHEGGSRVPLFMRLPGLTTPGRDIDALTRHYDLFPTLAELADAKIPVGYELDGRSLVPLLKDPNTAWPDRDLFFHVGRWNKKGAPGQWGQGNTDPDAAKYKQFAVRNKKWRLVGESLAGESLYDIENDPGETTDVAKNHPDVAASMLKSYDAWWDEVRPMMVNEDASLDVEKPFQVQFEKQKASGGIPAWTSPKIAQPTIAADSMKPNILILYADDLGFGDLGCYNADSKIPTPNLDKLAASGVRFTDGHSSSGICTPSRYAMLTGRHHWRDFHGIVNSLGRSVFDPSRLTLPEMLGGQGYTTACIGKWHLGWDWDAIRKDKRQKGDLPDHFDWSKTIPDGPLAHGFDHYFGDTVINFPPYAWIEDDKMAQVPDTMMDTSKWPKIKEGNWECRPGPMVSGWNPYDVLPTLTDKGVSYLRSREGQTEPFFLYFAFPCPHAPIIPNDEFDGKSGAGPYGDFVVETDAMVGRLLGALDQAGLADNTIVVFTADNGPEHYAYARDERFGHWSTQPLRGLKRDLYEGGHHVPMIMRWPGVTEPATTSDALVSQIDLMATFAAATDASLIEDAAEDSHNMLPYLRGESETIRPNHVHNTAANQYAIRDGDWLLVDAKNGYLSRGFADWEKRHGYPVDDDQPVELYNLSDDIGQRHNLASEHPDRVASMKNLLEKIRGGQGTRPSLSDSETIKRAER